MNLKRLLFGKRLIVLIGVLLTMAAAPVGILTFQQYMDAEATSTSVNPDAQAYADEWGIDVNEATRRLNLQETIGEMGAELRSNEAATFGGLWITHGSEADDFGAVVRFTDGGETTLEQYSKYIANGPLAGMVEARPADKTVKELRTIRKGVIGDLDGLGIPVASGINVYENRAEVYVVDRSRLESAMATAGVELPDKAILVTVEELAKTGSDIYGGLDTEDCTLGFSVENTDGSVRGVTTAGHCWDGQDYDGHFLPMQDEFFNSDRDIQWNTAPGFTVTNEIYATGRRDITSVRPYANQTIGTFVCKRGQTTGYGCGYIAERHYLPDDDEIDDDPGCEPSPCSFVDTWVRIHKDGERLLRDGDSGGPVFSRQLRVWFNGIQRRERCHLHAN